jgi:RNA-directed DNA polymerase
MHGRGKSDGPVLPAKPPNNATSVAAEVVEGRGPAEGNAVSETRPGRRAGVSVSSELGRVRRVARKDSDVRFTALLHHVTVERLEQAYRAIRPGAAPGVDGVTWRDYGQDPRRTSGVCMPGSTGAPTERGRLAGATSRRPTGG